MDQDKILEQINACRAGRNDLDLPEMSELSQQLEDDAEVRQRYRRALEFDAALGAAMHDVALPEGLNERLLTKLEDAQVQAVPEEQATPKSRRRWISMAAAVAVALLIGSVGLWTFYNLPPSAIDRDQIHQFAVDQFPTDRLVVPLIETPGPGHLRPSGINTRLIKGWHETHFAYRSGVAYHLSLGGRKQPTQAVLYVTSTAGRPSVPAWLPVSPDLSKNATVTGRVCTTWAVGNRLYVLVVEGNHPLDLERFIRTGHAT